jgi:DMSO/TMAO reductase YedYZ molybdopterin-dependent catalytic subunit
VAAAVAAVAVHGRRRRTEAAAAPTDWLPPASAPPTDGAEAWDHATPLVTPLDQFHVTDVNFGAPAVQINTWRLSVTGEVARPVDLDWEALLALGTVDIDAAMVCIHNRVGWERVANARWQGVPLAALRDLVGAKMTSTDALTKAADGFTISLPLAELEAAGMHSYIVVGMNGHPLTAAHGFPARFMVPGLYGQFAGVKWLTGIHFTNYHIPGDWERRGWPPEAVMARTHSRIDAVRQMGDTILVTGVAWAPPNGVAAVEVSVDGGPWVGAELAAAVGPMAWRRWRSRLVLAPGPRRIRARSIRADGQVQDGEPRPPFPSGVSGYHEVVANVAYG